MKRRTATGWVALLAVLGALGAVPATASPGWAATSNVTVGFGSAVRSVSPAQFGLDVTGYGYGNYITNDAAEQAMLNGRYGVMRMGLKYSTPGDPNSTIVANGAGADTTVTGDQWVTAIKNLGATPMVIVPENVTDAANMVRHFNTGPAPNRVPLWIIGNEPDNAGESATTYAGNFNQIYDAMKAVDPTIKVGGPATAWPNMSFIQTFLNISGTRTDFIDFHQYGEGGSTLLCDSQLLANTTQWESNVDQIRTMIQNTVPSRAASIGIQVGELNTDWSTDNNPPSLSGCGNIGTEPVQYRNVATVIIASYYLHLVDAGATGLTYGDKNGALGIVYDQPNASRPAYAQNGAGLDERMPAYQGEGFFTGESGTSLSHFGTTLVQSGTTLPGVEVAASSSPKVVVLINKGSSSQNAVVGVGSGVTHAVGYQKDGNTVSYALPATLPLAVTNGQVAVNLPAWSVTQLVLS